jgi:ADP-ribosylglycohydrolase
MDSNEVFKKVYGALAGVAVGDSMGMPVEMWPRGKIQRRFGKIEDFLPAPDDNEITRGLGAYEVTDDTESTIVVAESVIAARGAVIPRDIVERISAWAASDSKSTNVLGPSTKRAFAEIARGVPIEEAGRFGETNGASMRIVPVGAVSDARNLIGLVDKVRLACSPTHNTGVAIAGAAAVAAAVATGLGSRDAGPEEALRAAIAAADLGQKQGFEGFAPSVARRIELGLSLVRERGEDAEEAARTLSELVGTGLPTQESVPTALALVLLAQGEPLVCARLAANIGGDTDTIGAMSTGVCGALSGIDAFPSAVLRRLDEVNGFDLEKLARRLTAIRLETIG